MNTVTDKEMVKFAVASAKRAMNRYPAYAVKREFNAVEYFAFSFHTCSKELQAEMVAKLTASTFYKNRMN